MTRDPRSDPRPGDIVATRYGTQYKCHQRDGNRLTFTCADEDDDGVWLNLDMWCNPSDTVVYAVPDPTPQPEAKLTLDGLRSLYHHLNAISAENTLAADRASRPQDGHHFRGRAVAYANAAKLLLTEITALENP